MEKEIYDESNGLYYTLHGDYYLPNLVLPESAKVSLGKYGILRREYLKEYRPVTYETMLLSGKLFEHLAEVDSSCWSMMDRLIPKMAKAEGITEELKARDQMRWVGLMNNLHSAVEEIVLKELVYV